MADLIDRQELISWLSKDPLFPQVESFGLTSVIESRPSVDAVPVVRCKDCKWFRFHKNAVWCEQEEGLNYPRYDSFCSYGERKEDETD